MSYWRPSIATSSYVRRPEVGWTIAVEGKAYLVKSIDEVHQANWSERAVEMWTERGMPDPWDRRPFRIRYPDPQKPDKHLGATVEPWHYSSWHILPEHYAVCVLCGELSPCRTHLAAVIAAREIAAATKQMQTPDGFCPACVEPITQRQKVYVFPGPNLLNPLGGSGVRFHARRKCRDAATSYEEQWVAAEPGRDRSLLTLTCVGTVIVHQDGDRECRASIDCPTVYAKHRMHIACYAQSHGCGRGCTRTGHPGC